MSTSTLSHHRGNRSVDWATIASVGIAALTGWAISRSNLLLALLPTVSIVGLSLLTRLSLVGWCVVFLLLSVGSRGVVVVLGLPELFNFVHYPAVVAFAIVASQRPRLESARLPASRWLTGLVLLVSISSIANWTNPLRALLFLVIVGEPIVLLWAIQRWGVDDDTERRVGGVAIVGLLLQIPLGLWQGSKGGWQDAVQGTMVGFGAGAHTLGGLFALGLFVWLASIVAGRRAWPTAPIAGAVSFGMMGAAGASQVLFLAGAALPIVALLPNPQLPIQRGRRGPGITTSQKVLVATVSTVFLIAGPLLADYFSPGVLSRAVGLATSSHPEEIVLAQERARSSPLQFIVGSGPGTTSSRAALLLTPSYVKPGSMFAKIPLEPTALALHYSQQSQVLNIGSAEDPQSGMLGIIGDLGMLGLCCAIFMLFGMYRASRRMENWLSPAVAAALIMVFGLSFFDNWLEYPEFTIPLAILIGFGTTGRLKSTKGRGGGPTTARRLSANPRGA